LSYQPWLSDSIRTEGAPATAGAFVSCGITSRHDGRKPRSE